MSVLLLSIQTVFFENYPVNPMFRAKFVDENTRSVLNLCIVRYPYKFFQAFVSTGSKFHLLFLLSGVIGRLLVALLMDEFPRCCCSIEKP